MQYFLQHFTVKKLYISLCLFSHVVITGQTQADSDYMLLEKKLVHRKMSGAEFKIKINRYVRDISCAQIESEPSSQSIKLNTQFNLDPFSSDPTRIQYVHGIPGRIHSPIKDDLLNFYRLLNQRQLIETVTMLHKYKKTLCEIKLTQKADQYVIKQFAYKGLEFYKDYYVLSPISFEIVNIYPHPEQVEEGSRTNFEFIYYLLPFSK